MLTASRTVCPDCVFSTTASFRARSSPVEDRRSTRRDRQHHPLLDARSRRRRSRSSAASTSCGLDLGQVAEQADVDAEDRDLVPLDQVDRPQHRAVAAEADREVDAVRELLVRRPRAAGASRPPRRPRASAPRGPAPAATGRLTRQLGGTRTLVVHDQRRPRSQPHGLARSHRRCVRPAAPPAPAVRAWTKNSTFPFDATQRRHHPSHDDRSAGVQRARHVLEDRSPRRRVGDHASTPVGLDLARLELRLHEQDEITRRHHTRRAARRATARSEMNERSATTTSTAAERARERACGRSAVRALRPAGLRAVARASCPCPTSTATTAPRRIAGGSR